MPSLCGTNKSTEGDVCQWVRADVGVFIRNKIYRGMIMPGLSNETVDNPSA